MGYYAREWTDQSGRMYIVQVGVDVKPTVFLQQFDSCPEKLTTNVQKIEVCEARISLGYHGSHGRPYATLPVKFKTNDTADSLYLVTGIIDTGCPITNFSQSTFKCMNVEDRDLHDHFTVAVMGHRIRPNVSPPDHSEINIW